MFLKYFVINYNYMEMKIIVLLRGLTVKKYRRSTYE